MKRIYYNGPDEDYETAEECMAEELLPDFEGGCPNEATYMVEDQETGEQWLVCPDHKEAIKATGVAS